MTFGRDVRPFGVWACRPGTHSPSHDGHSRRGLGGFVCIAAHTRLGPNLIPDPYVLVCVCRYIGLVLRTIQTCFLLCN